MKNQLESEFDKELVKTKRCEACWSEKATYGNRQIGFYCAKHNYEDRPGPI